MEASENRAPATADFARPFKAVRRPASSVTQMPLAPSGKSVAFPCPILPDQEGRLAQSPRTLDAGCDGRVGVARRAAQARTAKPCGPDLPTLRSSPPMPIGGWRGLTSPYPGEITE